MTCQTCLGVQPACWRNFLHHPHCNQPAFGIFRRITIQICLKGHILIILCQMGQSLTTLRQLTLSTPTVFGRRPVSNTNQSSVDSNLTMTTRLSTSLFIEDVFRAHHQLSLHLLRFAKYHVGLTKYHEVSKNEHHW